jgi:hydrogenase/urease accessory protein HupE
MVFVLLCCSGTAQAHPLAPALLQLREVSPNQYEVLWRTSTTRAGRSDVAPQLPAACKPLGEVRDGLEEDAWVTRWTLRCDDGLADQQIAVSGLAESRITVILRLERLQNSTTQVLLDAAQPRYRVLPATAAPAVFPAYLNLGVEHLLTGFDHLLFVVGLFLLVRRVRPLLVTVTAFTLGHSVTLSLATLGFVHVNAAVTELGIALSILMLAMELARQRGQSRSWISRKPWLMASSFGLLHGLGFAGALAGVGLPLDEIPLALLAFNVGIELGQLALIALLLLSASLWRWLLLRAPRFQQLAPLAPAYLIGSLAAYWCFERAATWLSS